MNQTVIKTVIHGAGRMAQEVLAEFQQRPEFELIAVVSRSEPIDLWASTDADINWMCSLEFLDADVDLLIDFTLPGGPTDAAAWCQLNGVALLSGTTGLSDADKDALIAASTDVPVLWASNMSKGIALLSALARQAATTIGDEADVTISDIHHQHKQDAPSGTALTLAESVMEGHNEGEVAFISVRKGEVIGNHTISFELPGEMIEISHKAHERGVFAKGALDAGAWLSKQKSGYYSTSDWLHIG